MYFQRAKGLLLKCKRTPFFSVELVWNAFLKELPRNQTITLSSVQKKWHTNRKGMQCWMNNISDVINKAAALPPRTSLSKYRELLPDKWKQKNIAQE